MSFVTVVLFILLQDPKLAKAEQVLSEKPDDANANLSVGKHYLSSGDFEKALPFLLKGSDTSLKAAAKAEIEADQKNALVLLEIGDLWTQAMSKNKPLRQACLDRASWFYGKAWPDLSDLYKLKLRERLSKLYAPLAPVRSTFPQGWGGPVGGKSKADLSFSRVHSGGSSLAILPRDGGTVDVCRTLFIGTSGAKKLELTAWVLSDGTDSLSDGMVAHVYSASGLAASLPISIQADRPIWTKVQRELVLPADSEKVQLHFAVASSVGTIFADDISIRVDGKEVLKGGSFE